MSEHLVSTSLEIMRKRGPSRCVLKSWYCSECKGSERLTDEGYFPCDCGKSHHLVGVKLNP